METIRRGTLKFTINEPRTMDETNDCSVRALKNITSVPYTDAHAFCSKAGRQPKRGMAYIDIKRAFESGYVFGYAVTRVEIPGPVYTHVGGYSAYARQYTRAKRQTVAQTIRSLGKGRYYVITTTHAFAVIDGVVHDSGVISGARCGVYAVWKFTPSSEVEGNKL